MKFAKDEKRQKMKYRGPLEKDKKHEQCSFRFKQFFVSVKQQLHGESWETNYHAHCSFLIWFLHKIYQF